MNVFDKGQLHDYTMLAKAISNEGINPECYNFPDAFFPTNLDNSPTVMAWAKQMCAECPVRAQCAEYAIKWEDHGLWGGLMPRERMKLRAKMGVRYIRRYDDEDLVA